MELRDLFREVKDLAPGTLTRANVAFLLEEGRLRHETGKFKIEMTRVVDKQDEEEMLVADIWRRRVYPIERRDRKPGKISVGRTKQCDISIELSSVSSIHATIEKVAKGQWTVTDEKSRNGTNVDGTVLEPGKPVPLRSGSSVFFGKEVRLTFLDGAAMEHFLKQMNPVLQRASTAPQPPRPAEALPAETPATELPTTAAAKKDPFAAALSALVKKSTGSSETPTISNAPTQVGPAPAKPTPATKAFSAVPPPAPPPRPASQTAPPRASTPAPMNFDDYLPPDEPFASAAPTPAAPPPAPASVLPVKNERPLSVSCPPFPPVGLLTGVPVVVGRAVGCDLILPHPNVSRRHAMFERNGDQVTVADMGSGNGVWVAKQKIAAKTPVNLGDQVGIGPYKVIVSADTAPTPVVQLDNSTRLEMDA